MARRIREADLADLDALTALVSEANETYRDWTGDDWSPPEDGHERQHWTEQIAKPDAWVGVAEQASKLVGCIDFMPSEISGPDIAHLSRLFVTPGEWRSGIGTDLCLVAIAEMRQRGFDGAELFVAVANAGARASTRGTAGDPLPKRPWQGLQLLRCKIILGQ